MATTETRPGFRLPWSTDHRTATDEPESAVAVATDEVAGAPHESVVAVATEEVADGRHDAGRATQSLDRETHEPEAPVTPIATSQDPGVERDQSPAVQAAERSAGPHRPAKFLADLTKAMQVAALAEREETLSQYRVEAKAFIEQIQSGSAGRAVELRKEADEDIAAIKEWSKAEMARIREQTEGRVSGRKADLEADLKRHEAHVEHEVELVQARIDVYQEEMAAFFEQLMRIEDPTAFAAMATNLPEPPPFGADDAAPAVHRATPAVVPAPEPTATDDTTQPEAAATAAPALVEQVAPAEVVAPTEIGTPVEVVATAEVVTRDEVITPDDVEPAPPIELVDDSTDPRIAALGLTPDFAAAEAEAAFDAATVSGDGSDDEGDIPTVDDEALALRLAGLVPTADESAAPAAARAIATTQVAVVGLVSVASIASFKRHLARVPGVQSVAVSSGPDGEFVFAVVHHDDVSLREIVPTLPGFQARVSSAGDGIVNVTAHDPESES